MAAQWEGCPGIIMRLEDAALLIRCSNANVDGNDAFTNTMAPMWPILTSDRKIMETSDESLWRNQDPATNVPAPKASDSWCPQTFILDPGVYKGIYLKRCFSNGSLLNSVLIKSAEPFQHRCAVSFSLCCPHKPPSLSAPQHGSPWLIANTPNWSPEEPIWGMTCSSKKKKKITKKWRRSYKDITVTGAVEGHIVDNEIFVIGYEGSVAHHPGWTTCQVKIHKYEVQLKAHHSLMEINCFTQGKWVLPQPQLTLASKGNYQRLKRLARLLKVASPAQSCSELLHSDQTRTSQTEMRVKSLRMLLGERACSLFQELTWPVGQQLPGCFSQTTHGCLAEAFVPELLQWLCSEWGLTQGQKHAFVSRTFK